MKFSYKDCLFLFFSLAIGGLGVFQPLHPWIGHVLIIIGCFGILFVLGFNIYRTRFKGSKKLKERPSYEILSATMKNMGRGNGDSGASLVYDLTAKVHINTSKPATIVFKKCTAELKHRQYPDIQSEFMNIILTEEDLTDGEMDAFGVLTESKASQIFIDRPSTVMLLARFITSEWKPGDKESLAVLFELPVSERPDKPIKISVEMSNIGGGMDFATIT